MAAVVGKTPSAKTRPAAASLQFQTSAQGGVIPLVYGTQRVAGNLLDYDDFATHTNVGGTGLKTAKTAGASSSTTTFSASYIEGFCQGPVTNTGDFWWDKSIADGIPAISTSNLGADGQPGDPYWQSTHPEKFLNYSGTMNLTLDNGNLGKASTLPNLSVEIVGILANSGVNNSDADPAQLIVDFLTNVRYGSGFPPENLAPLDAGDGSFQAYCRAVGIFLSPLLDTQQPALNTLGTLVGLANSEIVWSGNLLKIIPRGDHPLSASYRRIGTSGTGAGSTVNVSLTNGLWGGTLTATYTLNGKEATASMTGAGLANAINNIPQFTANGIFAGVANGGLQIMMQGAAAQTTSFSAFATGGASCAVQGSAGPFTYTPPTQAIYSLGDDDFISQESTTGGGRGPNTGSVLRSGAGLVTGGFSNDPVKIVRTSPADAMNFVVLQCKNRGGSYNDHIVETFDQGAIDLYGIRKDTSLSAAAIADPIMVGAIVGQLLLQRQLYYRNTYTFQLGWRFCLLEPMDLVQITDTRMGINALTVRITAVQEDDEGLLTFTAEDFFGPYNPAVLYPDVGVVQPPLDPTIIGVGGGTATPVPKQGTSNFTVNAARDPGNAAVPLIFEPPAALTDSVRQVWIALAGGDDWGGAEVWSSTDDSSYSLVGTILGPSIYGVLTVDLATYVGADPDVTGTLSIDLSISKGQLTSVSAATAANLLTLCYVDGEFLAFETATLTGSYSYDLTNLYRNGYGAPSAHLAGTQFARLDQQIGRFPYPPTLVGQTIYFKFPSFNMLQGGTQDISSIPSYSFTTTGSSGPP